MSVSAEALQLVQVQVDMSNDILAQVTHQLTLDVLDRYLEEAFEQEQALET